MRTGTQDRTWQGLEELRPGLHKLLAHHSRDENEIEDVVQETFVRAARYRSGLCDRERLRSWVGRIALNVLSDNRRRGGRVAWTPPGAGLLEAVPEAEDPSCAEEATFTLGRFVLDKDQALLRMREALETLRHDDQVLLNSYYRGKESCRATAAECDIPGHLVKIRLFRARRRLLRAIRQRLSLSGAVLAAERLPQRGTAS